MRVGIVWLEADGGCELFRRSGKVSGRSQRIA
jgi:hypothetical protein